MERNIISDFKPGFSFNILLVEDQFLNRRLLKNALEKSYTVKEADDADKARELLQSGIVHLAIIDIHLGNEKTDGISLGKYIHEAYGIPFIYLTAFSEDDISQRAVATQPAAYITKPFKEVDLRLTVDIALRKYLKEQPVKQKWILVKEEDASVKLPVNSIDYLESKGNYVQVFSDDRVYKCRSTIKEMLEVLPDQFAQTHRAFVVNKAKIEKYSSAGVTINGTLVPVSGKFNDQNLFL